MSEDSKQVGRKQGSTESNVGQRKMEIARLMRRGMTPHMIAEQFNISVSQVKRDYDEVLRSYTGENERKYLVSLKLEELAEIKRVSWQAYERSMQDFITTKYIKGLVYPPGHPAHDPNPGGKPSPSGPKVVPPGSDVEDMDIPEDALPPTQTSTPNPTTTRPGQGSKRGRGRPTRASNLQYNQGNNQPSNQPSNKGNNQGSNQGNNKGSSKSNNIAKNPGNDSSSSSQEIVRAKPRYETVQIIVTREQRLPGKEFLQVILNCIDQERKILGLDEAQKVEVSGSMQWDMLVKQVPLDPLTNSVPDTIEQQLEDRRLRMLALSGPTDQEVELRKKELGFPSDIVQDSSLHGIVREEDINTSNDTPE